MAQRTADLTPLLAPGRIGPVRLDNRVLMSAMDMNLSVDGVIEAEDVEHFVSRAAGGTGMIITGCCSVGYPAGSTSTKEPGLSSDHFIPGLRALADGVHDAGSKLCVQMVHHGKVARIDTVSDRPLQVASAPQSSYDMSALADNTPAELGRMGAVTGGKTPTYHEVTLDDIAEITRQYVAAARRVREAGADAVEIHCAHGYLLSGFLSRADNRRTDEYGGSLENRARFACEVIAAVKGAVGDDLAVLVRVSGREFGEAGGLSTDEAARAARMFESAGADAIDVTGWGRNPFSNFTDGPLPDRLGAFVDLAAVVKESVSIPVITVGRVLPEVGAAAIADGKADFVAMGRQLLADPDLVNKLRAGTPERVRPCINCYVCVQENFWDDVPVCAVNPALGNDGAAPLTLTKAPESKKVVVVGAGPAGLETARIAAQRGHRVTVLDKSDRLGGTLWFSALTTPANYPLLDWLRTETARLGVEIRLNTEATPAAIAELAPDAVIVATGAVRDRPAIPGGDLPHVHTGDTMRALMTGVGDTAGQTWYLRVAGRLGKLTGLTKTPARIAALTRKILPVGKDVVVIGGSLVGLELAEFLAERGRNVTLLHDNQQLGLPMALPRRWTAVRRAKEAGVTIHRHARPVRITASSVEFKEAITDKRGQVVDTKSSSVPASMVIMAAGVSAAAPLAQRLDGLVPEVHVVGDAGSVDYIQGAIHSAWQVASAL
ncbi:NAD(P)/FAD-dependent oxidoreductase [Gordonia neofelifaecis]|uniref:NADH-dependent oxidoreductase n=1 Tax=Gordonia neofelifaecis NRRL B-59395 TaxID=644548 RepID=F1YFT4_9ACTN|nr:NAD(P)/FAD-dependent oxidoreductase [Gordonia neofelifaecis]EGD56511.1 NADH-dependent oxidoreductase [Gordonia neofelifaecis NRRL B-59395]